MIFKLPVLSKDNKTEIWNEENHQRRLFLPAVSCSMVKQCLVTDFQSCYSREVPFPNGWLVALLDYSLLALVKFPLSGTVRMYIYTYGNGEAKASKF